MGHDYPGEGAAKHWQPGLLVIASAQIDSKTEKGGVVKGHNKKMKKIENQEKGSHRSELMKLSIRGYL